MSLPSKRIVPALGVSCSRISFEVVVLPQPDSPISPNVSPAAIARSTPSTALTQPFLRQPIVPAPAGKYLRTPSSSSSGADIPLSCAVVEEPAFGRPARGDRLFARFRGEAFRHRVRAARVKGAAPRQLRQIGRMAGDRVERLLAAELRGGAEQSRRI